MQSITSCYQHTGVKSNQANCPQIQQGNRRYQTSPAVCNPIPAWRPITDSSKACNQASAPIVCMLLHGPVQFATHKSVRLVGHVFRQNCFLPFRDQHPHVTHCCSGQAHSSSQTASQSVQTFLHGCQCYAVQWGKPTKLPLPLRISSPCRRRTEPQP